MLIPRRETIRRIATAAGVENPELISGFELRQHLQGLPKHNFAGVDPDALLAQLEDELDGANPIF